MTKQTFGSVVIWIGIAVFAYLKWHFPDGRPTDFTSHLAVGAWFSGGILLFAESGYSLMTGKSAAGDRAFGTVMLLSAVAVSIGLFYHLITSNQPGLLMAMFAGAAMYLALLRQPFVMATR